MDSKVEHSVDGRFVLYQCKLATLQFRVAAGSNPHPVIIVEQYYLGCYVLLCTFLPLLHAQCRTRHELQLVTYVADRNGVLFCCVFWGYRQVRRTVALSFCVGWGSDAHYKCMNIWYISIYEPRSYQKFSATVCRTQWCAQNKRLNNTQLLSKTVKYDIVKKCHYKTSNCLQATPKWVGITTLKANDLRRLHAT